MSADRTLITISFSGDVILHADEVWPDGDFPDEVTAEAVAEVITRDHDGPAQLLRDWGMSQDVEVTVLVHEESVEVRWR